mgnify:CR=1 FL=1
MDLFIGKSSVQTNIYVFRVGETHQKDDTVKFIDFSVDGYTRTNRKKASCNLRDTDHAKERYQELVDLVRFGKAKLNIFTEKEYYEGTIDLKMAQTGIRRLPSTQSRDWKISRKPSAIIWHGKYQIF